MPFLLIMLLCSAAFGNAFFKFGSGQFNVLNAVIAIVVVYYIASLVSAKRRNATIYKVRLRCDRWLWALFVYGIVVVILSYCGFYTQAGFPVDVLFDVSYIPRQAYYIFFLPLIVLVAGMKSTESCLVFVGRSRRLLFACVYIAYLIWHRTFALNVPCCFCLGSLLLFERQRDSVLDICMLAIVLFSPIMVGGEMTQLLIRAICLAFYIAGFKKDFLRLGLVSMVLVIIACYVAPYLPLASMGLDTNTVWRAQYWGNELDQLWATYGLGVGYGTSYATWDFIGAAESGPFAETSEYSTLEKVYVVGCHNSFVTLAFRLGVPGAAMIIAFVLSLGDPEREYKGGYATSAAFCIVSALVIVCFNVGFENPSYFFMFVFSVAFLNASLVSNGTEDGGIIERKLSPR